MNNSFTHWINKHQLLSFFVLTYALMFSITFTYIYWIPLPYARDRGHPGGRHLWT